VVAPACTVIIAMIASRVSGYLIWAVAAIAVGFTVLAVINHAKDRIRDLAARFDDRFNLDNMRSKRRAVAKYFLGKGGSAADLDYVLDFFQDIGFAFKKGEIDGRTVRHDFYTWLQLYWESSYDYILKAFKAKGVWGDIFPLYQMARKLDGMPPLTEQEKREFWEDEENV